MDNLWSSIFAANAIDLSADSMPQSRIATRLSSRLIAGSNCSIECAQISIGTTNMGGTSWLVGFLGGVW